jgi:hypothetical protein
LKIGWVIELFELRIRHWAVVHANHVDVFAVKDRLLHEELEVDQLFVDDEIRSDDKDAAGGAGDYCLDIFDDHGEHLG